MLGITTLLSGYVIYWMLHTSGRIGSVQAEEILPILAIFLVIAAVSAVLLARFAASAHTVGSVILAVLAVLLVGGGIWTLARPDEALFWARQLGWGDSVLDDYNRFPERTVENAAPIFAFPENPSPDLFQTVEYRSDGEARQSGFEDFLASTNTSSFIVIQDGVLLYEGYFNGYRRDSILTSFSITKSTPPRLSGSRSTRGPSGAPTIG